MVPKFIGNLMNDLSDSYIISFKLFLFMLLIFGTFAHTIGDNENSRLDTTIALAENNTFSINELHNNTGDKSLIDGTYYSDKAPLPSLFALPGYIIVDSFFKEPLNDSFYLESFRRTFSSKMEWSRFAATVSVSATAGALTIAIIYLLSLHLGLKNEKALLISILSGLSTLVFPYSTTFHGTMLGTFFLLFAVFIWVKNDYRLNDRDTFFVSLLLGLGVSASYLIVIPGGLLLLLNSIDRFKNYRLNIKAGIGLLLGLSPLLIFNYLATGNPLEPTLLHNVQPMGSEPPGREDYTTLALFIARGIRGLISPLNGLFPYSPFLLFGILGLRRLFSTRKKLFWLVTLSFLGSILAISRLGLWHIRAYYGARYLLPVSTLLLIPLVLEFKHSQRFERALIYLSGTVSSLIMLGSTQPWLGFGWISTQGPHLEKMTSLGIYDNRLFSYVSSVFSEGFQSPILSYLIGTSSEFHMVTSSYAQYIFPIGELQNLIVLYDIRVIILLLFMLSGILLFRSQLQSVEKFNFKLALGIITIIFLLGFSSSSSIYLHDWYDQHPNEDVKWGKQNPEINFIAEDAKSSLELEVKAYTKKDIEILLNDKSIKNMTLDTEKVSIAQKIDTREGLNKLEFKTDRCDVIGRLSKSGDTRCVTLGLKKYNINSLKSKSFSTNLLNNDSRGYRSVINGSSILTDSGKSSIELEITSSSRTDLSILREDELITQSKIGPFPSLVKTPYKETEGITEFKLDKDCDNCTVYIQNINVVDYKRQPEDLLYRLGSNWYEKVESEQYQWSHRNPSIFVYNYQNKSVERIIWIEGRSFGQDREFSYWFNGKNLAKKKVPETGYRQKNGVHAKNKYGFKVTLHPGENILEMKTESKCTSLGEVNNNQDSRCSTYGLKNLYLTEKR
jgi:hypothetical protein